MAHKSVVRNVACQTSSFETRERHNERVNDEYYNGDVQLERSHLNVSFRRCLREDGTPETYNETFNRLLAERKIVKHGTKQDAKQFCEMVFDINTTYFDERGGYDYAKSFFEEAYRLAVKEAGSEDYIISAIMHADERNSHLSKLLGRDVYHYHLHVVYVPVVEKKLYFKKNNKNPDLAGTLKEVIPQISQSNKWPLRMTVEKDGKKVTRNSYSFLQDRYYEHMMAAGFDGFERGERGSTKEHLEVLEYKIQQDTIHANELTDEIEQKQEVSASLDSVIANREQASATLDEQNKKKKEQLAKLNEQIKVASKAVATIEEVDAMGKSSIVGGYHVTDSEMKKLKALAKKSVNADAKVEAAKKAQKTAEDKLKTAEKDRDIWRTRYTALYNEVKDFLSAIRNFPQRLLAFINEHWEERRQEQALKREHKREVEL
jgi:hypothetical protein